MDLDADLDVAEGRPASTLGSAWTRFWWILKCTGEKENEENN
jgi:hypothetical protein